MQAIAHYWAAAAFSGFATASDWHNWADREIEENKSPDYWVIALSLASTESDLLELLSEQMRIEELVCGHRIYIGNAKLGFIYWSFKLGRMSFAEFLAKAGDEADGGTGDLDCETIYGILNQFEERQASVMPWDDLLNQIHELFKPYLNIAKEQWKALGFGDPTHPL
jgi:hypothetical protein